MFPETAIVTGSAGGIGRAIVSMLEAEGASVRGLDLVDGFDVADPRAWEDVEAADLVCLNAGVLAKGDGTLDDYRRILGVNVDGVVFGFQALAPRLREGSAFVVTASLAGLIPMASDPLYVLTKHAVVGYSRSLAEVLEPRGIRVNLVCPGIVRSPMTEAAQAELDAAGFPLMEPEQIARGRPPRGSQRGDGSGLGVPAGPRAAPLQVPERPRPARRGRRGHGRPQPS